MRGIAYKLQLKMSSWSVTWSSASALIVQDNLLELISVQEREIWDAERKEKIESDQDRSDQIEFQNFGAKLKHRKWEKEFFGVGVTAAAASAASAASTAAKLGLKTN